MREPELKTFGEVDLCTFSIAVNRRFKDKDGNVPCDFFNVNVWRGQAKSCSQYLKKGSQVAVMGEMQNNNYDKEDGTKVYGFVISASNVQFLRTDNQQSRSDGGSAPTTHAVEEDMPF